MAQEKRIALTVEGADNRAIDLLNAAHKGDADALKELKKHYPTIGPWLAESYAIGDIIHDHLIRNTFGKDLVMRESLEQQIEILRKELGGANATPLERMLIEQVLTSWLWLQMEDARCSNSFSTPIPVAQAEYWQRRQENAHRRYMQSLTTLARVRRLQIPLMQVNIAQPGAQQLNVATSAPTADTPQLSE